VFKKLKTNIFGNAVEDQKWILRKKQLPYNPSFINLPRLHFLNSV